jgi:hypothetical protein
LTTDRQEVILRKTFLEGHGCDPSLPGTHLSGEQTEEISTFLRKGRNGEEHMTAKARIQWSDLDARQQRILYLIYLVDAWQEQYAKREMARRKTSIPAERWRWIYYSPEGEWSRLRDLLRSEQLVEAQPGNPKSTFVTLRTRGLLLTRFPHRATIEVRLTPQGRALVKRHIEEEQGGEAAQKDAPASRKPRRPRRERTASLAPEVESAHVNPRRALYEELRSQIELELQAAQGLPAGQQRDLVEQLVARIQQYEPQLNSIYHPRLLNQVAGFANWAYEALVTQLITPAPTPEQAYMASVRKRAIAALLKQYKAPLLAQAVEMVDTIQGRKGYKGGEPEFFYECPSCSGELCGCCRRCHMVDSREGDPRCPARMPELERCHAWIVSYQAIWAVLNEDKERGEDDARK